MTRIKSVAEKKKKKVQ